MIGLQLDRATIARQRLLESAAAAQRVAKIVVRPGIVGPQLQRTPQTGYRFVVAIARQQSDGEVRVRLGILWDQRRGALQSRDAILALQMQSNAERLPSAS